MPSLTLKDIPEDLLERLRKIAKRERRSLSQQLLFFVEQALSQHENSSVIQAPPTDTQQTNANAWRRLAGKWQAPEEAEKG